MTREEIEQLNETEPYCFETDREKQWFNVGLKEGLKVADANPKSPWISVFDSLPCNHKDLIDNDISTALVFVKTKYSVGTDYMRLYCDFTWKWERYHGITHWMPIPEPPKL